jgi:hypothetical protein
MKPYEEYSVETIRSIQYEAIAYFGKKVDINEVDSGVTRNTFISLWGYCKPPSQTYRKWAETQKKSIELGIRLQEIESRGEFEILHKQLVDDLDKFWNEDQNKGLSALKINQLVDLFFMFLGQTKFSQANKIIQFANIPLDKCVLKAAKNLFRKSSRVNRILSVIVSHEQQIDSDEEKEDYSFIQNQIFQLMSEAGLPNLYFIVYAKNEG